MFSLSLSCKFVSTQYPSTETEVLSQIKSPQQFLFSAVNAVLFRLPVPLRVCDSQRDTYEYNEMKQIKKIYLEEENDAI